MEFWTLTGLVFGLAICLEGLPYFVAPGAARATLARLAEFDDRTLRIFGLTMISIGLMIAWFAIR